MRVQIVSEICPVIFQLILNREIEAIQEKWEILNIQFQQSYCGWKEETIYSALISYK
jgi:hypothetical protein